MAKPKLALIPAAQGTKLYSVLPSDGSGDFDFTRGSTTNPDATRINAQGLIESVANTSSRLNYPLLDGKVVGCPHHILEPQRTNVLLRSEELSNNAWAKLNSTVTANNAISPDGLLTADLLQETTANGSHDIRQNTANLSTGQSYTYSIFVKEYEQGSKRDIRFFIGGVNSSGIFSFTSKSFYDSTFDETKVENYGNGWYKLSITDVVSGTAFNNIIILYNTTSNYIGDGTSGVYLWGAMLEQGSFPTSYIKTSGNTTTRLAETATGSGSAATFNDSEGVLMAEISALADDFANYKFISLYDGTFNNFCDIYYGDASDRISVRFRSGGGGVINMFSAVSDVRLFNKVAITWKLNEFKLFINGFSRGLVTSGAAPVGLNKLDFHQVSNSNPFYGNTKQIQYFDTALTDTQLEELTSWDSFSDMANGQLYTIE